MSIKITWMGHACFKLESGGYSVVIDPYTGIPGLDELCVQANEVLCSHSHGDHNYIQAVDIIPHDGPCPFEVTRLDSFHDSVQGAKSGKNIIHMLACGGLRVAHFGDLGHIPDAETLKILSGCHALMVPVGGHYTIDAETAKHIKDALPGAVFIPMHYRGADFGPGVIATLDTFLALVDDVTLYDGNAVEITGDQPPQTAVLKYIRGSLHG